MQLETYDKQEYIDEDRAEALTEVDNIDEFTKHEAMDRAWIYGDMWDQFILTNDFVITNESLYKQAHMIKSAIYAFYSAVANDCETKKNPS